MIDISRNQFNKRSYKSSNNNSVGIILFSLVIVVAVFLMPAYFMSSNSDNSSNNGYKYYQDAASKHKSAKGTEPNKLKALDVDSNVLPSYTIESSSKKVIDDTVSYDFKVSLPDRKISQLDVVNLAKYFYNIYMVDTQPEFGKIDILTILLYGSSDYLGSKETVGKITINTQYDDIFRDASVIDNYYSMPSVREFRIAANIDRLINEDGFKKNTAINSIIDKYNMSFEEIEKAYDKVIEFSSPRLFNANDPLDNIIISAPDVIENIDTQTHTTNKIILTEPEASSSRTPITATHDIAYQSKSEYKVYWVENGKVWHSTKHCHTLNKSDVIYSGTIQESGKERACKVCD